MAKISKSYILTPHPQGHVMSVKCEQPLDELTVQVWLLYDHPNFKYCTLFISKTELQTDKLTDGQTIQTLDAPPADLSGRGHKNYGTKWKVLWQGIHICNIKALSLLVWKLWPKLKFFKSRSNFKVKVTRSNIMVLCERSCHKEYTYEIWKLLMVWKLRPRLKFLSTQPTPTLGLWHQLPGHSSRLAKNS